MDRKSAMQRIIWISRLVFISMLRDFLLNILLKVHACLVKTNGMQS